MSDPVGRLLRRPTGKNPPNTTHTLMEFKPHALYHVYNRGNNSQKIFFSYANYLYFLKKVDTHLLKHCDLLAYCLTPNHFHLLIETNANLPDDVINRAIQTILNSYSQAINKQENRTGSLFQQPSKAKFLENNASYAETCFHYIHQNPLRAGLVRDIENWKFSSVKDYALLRNNKICNLRKARLLFDIPDHGSAFLKLSNEVVSKENLDIII